MYTQILTPRQAEVITIPQLCDFARVDTPAQYLTTSPVTVNPTWTTYQLFIDAATDTVESIAATACLYEQILETYDCFPGQQDTRSYYLNELASIFAPLPYYSYYGYPLLDSIEMVRRPVLVPSSSPVINNVVVTYYDINGNLQTLDPTTYTVYGDKITMNVGNIWPMTDRRKDCVQVTYWVGYSATDPTKVPSQLQLAILFLASHFVDNRSIVAVESTSEIAFTLNKILQPFKSYRIAR